MVQAGFRSRIAVTIWRAVSSSGTVTTVKEQCRTSALSSTARSAPSPVHSAKAPAGRRSTVHRTEINQTHVHPLSFQLQGDLAADRTQAGDQARFVGIDRRQSPPASAVRLPVLSADRS